MPTFFFCRWLHFVCRLPHFFMQMTTLFFADDRTFECRWPHFLSRPHSLMQMTKLFPDGYTLLLQCYPILLHCFSAPQPLCWAAALPCCVGRQICVLSTLAASDVRCPAPIPIASLSRLSKGERVVSNLVFIFGLYVEFQFSNSWGVVCGDVSVEITCDRTDQSTRQVRFLSPLPSMTGGWVTLSVGWCHLVTTLCRGMSAFCTLPHTFFIFCFFRIIQVIAFQSGNKPSNVTEHTGS